MPGADSYAPAVQPAVRILPQPLVGRLRLAARWLRFALISARAGYFDFVQNALRAEGRLLCLSAADLLRPRADVVCNICNWAGRRFYPNSGPGYDEVDALCPGCCGLGRHRALLALLVSRFEFFGADRQILEVAPSRGFQSLCLAQPRTRYRSFDLVRFAMERGDITDLRFDNSSVDYFVCLHVLEHVRDEAAALAEIRRVLRSGGILILQVPVSWDLGQGFEYDAPNPRETGHVRRYGRDLPLRLERSGFVPQPLSVEDVFSPEVIRKFGMDPELIFFARKSE